MTVVASNGQTVGTVVGVTKFSTGDPTIVARKDNGVQGDLSVLPAPYRVQ